MITLTHEEAQQVMDALEAALSDDQPYIVSCKHTVETLRAKLSEPEAVAKMQEMLEVQGSDGNWNYDPYMHGMYNGMEYMLSMVESREPVFREAPKKWLSKREPEPEPVAWMEIEKYIDEDNLWDSRKILRDYDNGLGEPLYTTPPQRDEASAKAAEWVGLTDEEYEAMAEQHVTNCYFDTLKYARAIESKLRKKNEN